jgi:hypothetical protein
LTFFFTDTGSSMDNNKKGRDYLRARFVKNAIPTQQDFADLIDAALNQKDDGLVKPAGEPLSIEALADGNQTVLRIYDAFADAKPAWTLSLRDSGKRSLALSDGDDKRKLVIDRETGALTATGTITANGGLTVSGNVGIGTTDPGAKLDVAGNFRVAKGVSIDEISADPTLAGKSDSAVPTQKAVKDYVDELLVGCVMAFAMETPPEGWEGWLECNGQAVSRIEYKALFDRIGTVFGSGDGATTFNVPDLRGLVVKGWDSRVAPFGDYQVGTFENHFHGGPSVSIAGDGNHAHGIPLWAPTFDAGWHGHGVSVGNTSTPIWTTVDQTSRSSVGLVFYIKC